MKARGSGQILQVSSVVGFVGLPCSAAYAASKHAVNGLVKGLRYELRGSGVRVWAACPNRTESEFHGSASRQSGLDRPRRSPAPRRPTGSSGRSSAASIAAARFSFPTCRPAPWSGSPTGCPDPTNGSCNAGARPASAARSRPAAGSWRARTDPAPDAGRS